MVDMPVNPHQLRDAQVDWFIERSGRTSQSVPLRRAFVQGGPQNAPTPGPVRRMLRHGDERALDLYLLFLNAVSAEPFTVTLDARLWSRALGLPTAADNGASTVSKIWNRLDTTHQLVERKRDGRLAQITALNESGDRSPYAHPEGAPKDPYSRLSWQYWQAPERYYRTLSFKAKVMLLIATSLKPGFALPLDKIQPWYGISNRTGTEGLQELEAKKLLTHTKQRRDDLGLPEGYVIENRYTLLPPFDQDWTQTTAKVIPLSGSAS